MSGSEVDLHAVTDGDAAEGSGVAHGEALVRFAEAVVGSEEEPLSRARARLLDEIGPAGLVDAAAVVGNFQRMVRIADATGIPLDGPLEVMSHDFRADLGLERFGSSANTPPPGRLSLILGRILTPFARPVFRLLSRRFRNAWTPPAPE